MCVSQTVNTIKPPIRAYTISPLLGWVCLCMKSCLLCSISIFYVTHLSFCPFLSCPFHTVAVIIPPPSPSRSPHPSIPPSFLSGIFSPPPLSSPDPSSPPHFLSCGSSVFLSCPQDATHRSTRPQPLIFSTPSLTSVSLWSTTPLRLPFIIRPSASPSPPFF